MMKAVRAFACLAAIGSGASALGQTATIAGKPYTRLETRQATRDAMLRQFGGGVMSIGRWHVLAPIPHPRGSKDIATPYPPEQLLASMKPGAPALALQQPITLGDNASISWRSLEQQQDIGGLGGLRPLDLRHGVPDNKRNNQVAYLYTTIHADAPTRFPVSIGSDDGLRLWLNGDLLIDANVERPLDPASHELDLELKPGVNHLFAKVSQGSGEWQFNLTPRLDIDPTFEAALDYQLDTDFPDAESRHYRIVTIPVPRGIEAEVGGIDILPAGDARPILCTRRGELYVISNAYDLPATKAQWKRFATGLQEPLGVAVRPDKSPVGWAVYTAQRAELTRLIDADRDDDADTFDAFCDSWHISGNYHEYAFGPKFDRDGNAWITLNLAHTGGETTMGTEVPTRGWAVKVSPDGVLHKVADGLRSPDGVGMYADGQMFYTDNQGDYIATCKLSPLFQDSFHGHQSTLRFRDGWANWKAEGKQVPAVTPPAVWFPYQKMGQSASDILLDDTNGKFGPFAGQLFVGDQTHATIMRVCLEKLTDESGNPVYQGACFPFRRGFLSGVHRMCWGQDGSMFVGMTDRGWGSVGPKRFGVQRLLYTGELPFEVATIRAAKDGFIFEFTKPFAPGTAETPNSFTLSTYTYLYRPEYGSPEVQTEQRSIPSITVLNDRTVHLVVDQMKPGFVYEFDAHGVRAADNVDAPLLHSKAYFTLNVVPR